MNVALIGPVFRIVVDVCSKSTIQYISQKGESKHKESAYNRPTGSDELPERKKNI